MPVRVGTALYDHAEAAVDDFAPADASERDLHRLFASLRTLRDQLQQRLGLRLPELSMGMSHDFEIALAEGAPIVRVGSAIFGGRAYPQPEQH